MKSGDSYRFTLSWGIRSEDSILAGEFLESLGNKKSRFLIKLVADYVRTLPETGDADGKVRIILESNAAGQQLVERVKSLVLAELEGKVSFGAAQVSMLPEALEEEADIGASFMLEGLDRWGS